uniref:RNA-directed DNA polymerase n=1 Tax=Fagus sylvatica TaxID=28930 RepID=A0A2N9GFI3_FAGSY
MEAGDSSAQPLSASERQLQALTANIQELVRQSAADRREMQELAKQNQELMTLLRSRGEIPSPGQGQNAEEIPRNETGRNQNQNDEGSSAHQNREPHPSQVADPTRSAADARAAKLEEELKEMREQMKEMKSQVKAKAAKNLDMLVHRSESPFTKRIDEYPLPAKFKVPQLETFDGFKDPLDYLDSFRTIMRLHGVSDEIMCRTFPTNLRGSARTWSARPANYLLNIRQREGESLRSYVQWFTKEAVQIDEPNEYVALTAFNAGLLKGDFLFQLCKDPPKSMSELMYEAQKFINAEDAFQARDEFLNKKRKEPEDRRFDSSRNKSSRQDYPKAERKNISSSNRREERPSSFTPLNMSIDQVLLQIQDNPDIKWPGKLRSDPTKRSKDLYCRFHRDHGHTTEDCFALKQQIEALIRQGKLGKFVRQDKPEVRHEPRPPRQDENKDRQEDRPRGYHRRDTSRKSLKMDDQVISFSEDDARNIHHPHDDTLVVTLTIAGFLTRRVLIDNGSSADIIYLPAYQQMKIDKEQLKPIDIPLVGFTGDKVKPLGVVSLIIEVGTYPKQVRTSVEFLVVDCPSAYNVIIGRPTLNKLRAVTSTYHLLVRFPTEHGIGELKGDQATARECYFASLGPEATHQTMKIDEGHKLVEPTEELEVIALDDDEPSKTTSIGTKNGQGNKGSHDQFPEEMCVDFTDLNKACPKDSFPLPRIDQLVDSTAGHRLLTFMDAFSGYNQIMMDDADQEKTSFITSKGLFCYKVMPFGLKNPGATYLRLMNKMFHHQIGRNEEVYVDDMLVKTKDERKHLEDLKETFETLRRYRMKLNPNKCVFGVSSGKFLGFMVSQRGIEANPDKIKAVLEMTPPRSTKEVQSLTGRVAALNRFVSRATDKCLPFFKTLRKAFIWTDEFSPTAVSSALIREDGGTQLPVYYTSKAFQGAEERYPAMEKLALALVIAAKKLRPYFQSHKIIVLTNHPLRKAMNKPYAAGRLIQWAVELMTEDEPSEEKPDEEWEIEIDGSSVKGAGGVGIVFKTPEGHLLKHSTRLQYPTTNNEAEYEALLTGLRIAKELGANKLKIRSDSQLIVGQVNGEYEEREDRMTKYLKLVRNAMKWFDEVKLVQIPREQNTEADALAKLASSDEATDQYIEIQHSPSHLEEELSPINVSNSWMTPIVNYLEDETLPSDPVEARKLKVLSTRFVLIQGVLYKRGFSLPYLRCLDKAEADYVMREVHEGICGNHSGARSLVHKLVRAGYYWPTMQKDAISYVRACDKCQRFGNLIHSPPETLTPMTAPWPFAQWGLDIMGPLPVGRRQLKFLVVGIDYFTKWVEAEPLATITEKNIRGFVWKAIICRFGIPRTFISDNGRQFDNSPFREFCEELGIHNHLLIPKSPTGQWTGGRTTARTPTGETPFRLTYGTEAVIPVEIGLTTWRTDNYDEGSNDAQLRSNLDLVDEVRDQAEARTRVYQQRMARYYDRRVKHREFKVGDLVLRKVTPRNKGPNPGKTGTHMGRTIQNRQVPQERHLSPGEVRRGRTTSPLERRTSEEILPSSKHHNSVSTSPRLKQP